MYDRDILRRVCMSVFVCVCVGVCMSVCVFVGVCTETEKQNGHFVTVNDWKRLETVQTVHTDLSK